MKNILEIRMNFMTNQIIERKKKKKKKNIYIYIYIYIYYLIKCEYFNNLNGEEDVARTCIMAGICTSTYPSLYSIEKVGDSPYPYLFNAGIPCQNGNEFGQYPQSKFICHV